MEAYVDYEVCIGCGLCPDLCPEIFSMEGEKAVAYVSIVPKEFEQICLETAQKCPVNAIIIEE